MIVNEKPFRYVAFGGTEFVADRSDFKGGLVVRRPKYHDELTEKDRSAALVADSADMMSFFLTDVYPKLNGFTGWSAVKITVLE